MKSFLVVGFIAFACLVATLGHLRAEPPALEGSWRLVSAEPELPVVIRHKEMYEAAGVGFSRGAGDYYSFMASGACNSWSSHLEFKSGRPQFYKEVASTAQHCGDERADFDRAFGRALSSTDSITITGDTLVTEGEDGKLIFERRR